MPETRTDRTARERVERYRRGQRDQVRGHILELWETHGSRVLERSLERLGLAALMQLRDALWEEARKPQREEGREA